MYRPVVASSSGRDSSRKGRCGSPELSLLARGRGLIDGSVEIECYPSQSLSLSGKSFLKPSQSKEGQSAKIYKPRCLDLPKTYITRRGQMILFTAPEDMIIGRSCQVYEQERNSRVKTLSRQVAKDLKNTQNLSHSALNYEDSGISEGEGDNTSPRLGEFTDVYLEKLSRVCQANEEESKLKEQITEDTSEIDGILQAESDSGIDTCSHPTTISGRMSALSNQSNSIVIPDGQGETQRVVRFDDNVDFIEADSEFEKDDMADLMATLISNNSPQLSSKHSKNVKKTSKKKLTKDEQNDKNKSCTPSLAKKNKTAGKKKAKKQRLSNEETELTEKQHLQSARAEQRRLEIERKRKEKRELEIQRNEEKIRQMKLLEEISSAYHDEPNDKENMDYEQSILSQINDGSLNLTIADNSLIRADDNTLLEDRTSLISELESNDESNAALKRSRELEELMKQKLMDEEKLMKDKGVVTKEQTKEQTIRELGVKLKGKEEMNYKMRIELEAQRYHERKAPPYLFSYFQYLPQQQKQKKKKSRTSTTKKNKS